MKYKINLIFILCFGLIIFFAGCFSDTTVHNYQFTMNVDWENYDQNIEYSNALLEPEKVTLEIRFPNEVVNKTFYENDKKYFTMNWTSVGSKTYSYLFTVQSIRGNMRGTGKITLKTFKDGTLTATKIVTGDQTFIETAILSVNM